MRYAVVMPRPVTDPAHPPMWSAMSVPGGLLATVMPEPRARPAAASLGEARNSERVRGARLLGSALHPKPGTRYGAHHRWLAAPAEIGCQVFWRPGPG